LQKELRMILNEFEIREELGVGPLYRICRARGRDGRDVILKTANREPDFKAAAQRLRHEFEISRRLRIDGVARGIELIDTDREAILILEDVGGRPLDGMLRDGKLELGLALRVAGKLAEILAALHQGGYIHRDIQPTNILIDPDTADATLHGLGIASLVPRAVQGVRIPGSSPSYISPELSGRTNRMVDYRTDFYSLGVTLFEMLTGQLPFAVTDPLELIHAHIAKSPPSASEIEPSVPQPVAGIVLKLMAKAAEDRYQGGLGLRHDLEKCLLDLKSGGKIIPFELGAEDPPAWFELSQHFYGREQEIGMLLRNLDDAAHMKLRVVMVKGYPGIGKTSLVQELRKAVFARKGWFAAGKYETLERGTPYSAIRDALRDLWRRMLADEPEQVEAYCRKLEEALGQNLGVIVDVAPELAAIVGETPPVSPLGTLESRNRFHLCFQQTLRALATEDHPLVLFLDDLQWADQSSLELIEGTLEKGLGSFLLLGAYRDSEVDERHPLQQSLDSIKDKGISVETLCLGPLERQDIQRLVADSLRIDMERAAPLADLVFRKTAGNAFFARAFLIMISEEGYLQLNREGTWSWDTSQIAALEATENVIDLAARKIDQIPGRIRHTIALAAALGHPLELENLAMVCGASVQEVEADLIDACRERILLKRDNAYQFEHDRLQESAYALIPVAARTETHLRIGRLLANQGNEEEKAVRVFDIVAHFNRALDLIVDPAERSETARMNLTAGRKAMAAAAFSAAYQHFTSGLALLAADAWGDDYALALALHTEAAEAASLTANFREADHLVSLVLANARSLLDKIPAYETQIAVAHARLLESEAFRITIEVVKLLGIEIPRDATPEDINRAAIETKGTVVAALSHSLGSDILSADNTESLAAMRLLTQTAVAAGLVDLPLYFMIAHRLLSLATRYSDSPEAPVAYIMAGGMLCYLLDDFENGCRAGDYGMELLSRSASPRWRAFCHFLFTIDINCWRLHFDMLVNDFAKAHRMGLESGDLMTASVSAYYCCEAALHAGTELGRLETLIQGYLNESQRIGVERVVSGLMRLEQLSRALRDGMAEISYEESPASSDAWLAWHVSADQTVQEVSVCHEMMALYLYGKRDAAHEAALRAHSIPWGCVTSLLPTDFYICLSILEGIQSVVGRERERQLAILALRQERIRLKARFCPVNHQHKLDLVEAQRLRMEGETERAREFYDRAIDEARKNRFIHEEALANELAAEFYFELGRERIAAFYLQSAVSAYGRWGAWGKLDQLYSEYPEYLSRDNDSSAAVTTASRLQDGNGKPTSEALDISIIERAAAALSQELDLPTLLKKLIGVLLQSAGAQRGFLLQEEGGQILIEASGSVDEEGIQVLQKIPVESCEKLSRSIVRYVGRSHETVVIGDSSLDERFAGTPYVAREKPKSILCIPVLHRGKPVAILYLENNLIRDAFCGERLAAIQLISSQAAVALENARLHDGLKQEVLTRRKAEEELRRALNEVARLKDRLHAENAYLREEILGTHDFDEIVGQSEALRKVLREVAHVAATDATVLILGETGTGKELIARAIHSRSSRKDCAMVRVNCASLPANLIESELFGHEKGAFTGALAKKLGRFELADGGTIFLDEIGELPLELQAKLLRVIQEGEFERVGSTTTQKSNIRVIAATNRDLKKEAEEGTFRSDLYYRLSVFPIMLPPLRDRNKDIPLLVWYFITKKQGELGKNISKVPKEVMDALTNYRWPGNIRELENVVERAIILSRGSTLSLDESFGGHQKERTHDASVRNLDDVERNHILHILEQCRWKIKGKGNAAEQLGLNPSTLFFRMKKHGIERP
jgi:transcriptional regulator with GAF, ATPase, and Fis domain